MKIETDYMFVAPYSVQDVCCIAFHDLGDCGDAKRDNNLSSRAPVVLFLLMVTWSLSVCALCTTCLPRAHSSWLPAAVCKSGRAAHYAVSTSGLVLPQIPWSMGLLLENGDTAMHVGILAKAGISIGRTYLDESFLEQSAEMERHSFLIT